MRAATRLRARIHARSRQGLAHGDPVRAGHHDPLPHLQSVADLHQILALHAQRHPLLDRAAVTFQLVLTKADGVKPPALERKFAEVQALARAHPAAYPDVVVTSSETGQGIEALRAAILTAAQ